MKMTYEEFMTTGRIINQKTLRENAESYNKSWDTFYLNEDCIRKKTAFFCHSHKDKDLVLGLRTIFEKKGIELYVDWTDHTMPPTPNRLTAKKLQDKIRKVDVFLYLVTSNSMKSTWCPWEIGFADAINKNIFIIPTSDDTGLYGNEYLLLYKNIQAIGYSNYLITDPSSGESRILNESSFGGTFNE